MWNLTRRFVRRCRLSRYELLGLGASTLTYSLWNASGREGLEFATVLYFSLFSLACLYAGRVCARVVDEDASQDVSTTLLFGFFALNSALYLLAWISPFTIVHNGVFLLLVAIAMQALRPCAAAGTDARGARASLVALGLSLAAATLWSQDSIAPYQVFPGGMLFKPWDDSYFHTCEIRMFRDAAGYRTLHDLRMVGRPIWVYHHASYLASALASAATGTSAFLSFGNFLVPFGVVLTGLAAYSLIRVLWGPSAGVAGAASLLLLPDASWQGLENHWLSYHWLQQVGPGGLYGVASIAVAWQLMFAGCRTGRLVQVGLSFAVALLSVHYKAHVFVANALLIALYPGFFFRRAPWRWRLAWLVYGLAAFIVVVGASQRIGAVPTIKLNFASIKDYLIFTVAWIDNKPLRDACSVFSPATSFWHDLGWGSVLLFYGTLGLVGLANVALALAVAARRGWGLPSRVRWEDVAFPLIVALNYLIMSMGLAYSRKTTKNPQELNHRPLVWAYFVAVVFAGGLIYHFFLEDRVRRSRRWRNAALAVLAVLLAVPYTYGRDVQVGSHWWGQWFTWQSYPRGWLECGRFIRETAQPGDVAQDSENDKMLTFSAICEHPPYASSYYDGQVNPMLLRRVQELKRFKRLSDAESIFEFARQREIRWYVLHPQARVLWPPSILATTVFSWNGYRVFAFGPNGPVDRMLHPPPRAQAATPSPRAPSTSVSSLGERPARGDRSGSE